MVPANTGARAKRIVRSDRDVTPAGSPRASSPPGGPSSTGFAHFVAHMLRRQVHGLIAELEGAPVHDHQLLGVQLPEGLHGLGRGRYGLAP